MPGLHTNSYTSSLLSLLQHSCLFTHDTHIALSSLLPMHVSLAVLIEL